MGTLFVLTFSVQAQEHTIRLVEVLPDDQFIVSIGDREYRALSADKVRELAKQKMDLETCKANESRFNDLITIEKQNTTIATQRADLEHGNFVRAMSMFEKERELRVQSQQFIPHGNKSNWLLKALDSPYSQAFWKIALPLAQTYGAYKK